MHTINLKSDKFEIVENSDELKSVFKIVNFKLFIKGEITESNVNVFLGICYELKKLIGYIAYMWQLCNI